jgi:subtilisin family serine protease
VGLLNPNASVVAGGVSDGDGRVQVPYDPAQWVAALAAVEPVGGFWTQVTNWPVTGQVIRLTGLPRTGPVGWWQLVTGVPSFREDAGSGIRVGVIDSGVGPNPCLDHVVRVGAFINGAFYPGAQETEDVQSHGTHVSGIIGARPVEQGQFAGIAPGAGLYVARVFPEGSDANQGDIANAIDALSGAYAADLINLSLTGAPSSIEHDAVIVAFQRGTVCVCAAGNQSGSPVGYPAAYPESVAVSALGLLNTAPADSMPGQNQPDQPDRYGTGGLFLAAFSNVGPQLLCASPGNGIISTIPSNPEHEAPYADMSGTSMSSPLVAGALAATLAEDPTYLRMQRDGQRAAYARTVVAGLAVPVLSNSLYEGYGLARTV